MSAEQLAAETVASVTKEALASPRLSPRNDENADDDFIEGDDLSVMSQSRPGTPKTEPTGNVNAGNASNLDTASEVRDLDPIPDAVIVEEKVEQGAPPSTGTEGPTVAGADDAVGASAAIPDVHVPDAGVSGEEEKKEDVAAPNPLLSSSEASKSNEELLKGKLEAALKRAADAEAEVVRRSEEMAALQLDYKKLKLLEEKVRLCVHLLSAAVISPRLFPHLCVTCFCLLPLPTPPYRNTLSSRELRCLMRSLPRTFTSRRCTSRNSR